MQKVLILLLNLLLYANSGQASLPEASWQRVENPGVDAFFVGVKDREYLTVVKNQSDQKMNFEGQSVADIAHTLTLLRRVSLNSFGITDWKLNSVKKSKHALYEVIQLQGSYTNKSEENVIFQENLYFQDKKFTQFSWIQPSITIPPTSTRIENLFKSLEKDYL